MQMRSNSEGECSFIPTQPHTHARSCIHLLPFIPLNGFHLIQTHSPPPSPFVPLSLIQLQLYPKSLMAKTVQKQAFTFDCLLVVDFSGFLACIDALNKRQMIIICAVAHSLSDFGYRTNKSCLLVACEWACCCCCYLLFCCFDMMLLCHRRRYHCLRISWAVAAAAAVAVVSFELMPSLDVQKGNRSVRQKTE